MSSPDERALEQQAREFMARGEFDEAIPLLRRILEWNHNNWRAHLSLGQCHFAKDEIKDGLGHFQEMVRLAPEEGGPAFLARGELLLGRGEPFAKVWFYHAAECFRKKNEMDRYDAVCQRIAELGWDPNDQI